MMGLSGDMDMEMSMIMSRINAESSKPDELGLIRGEFNNVYERNKELKSKLAKYELELFNTKYDERVGKKVETPSYDIQAFIEGTKKELEASNLKLMNAQVDYTDKLNRRGSNEGLTPQEIEAIKRYKGFDKRLMYAVNGAISTFSHIMGGIKETRENSVRNLMEKGGWQAFKDNPLEQIGGYGISALSTVAESFLYRTGGATLETINKEMGESIRIMKENPESIPMVKLMQAYIKRTLSGETISKFAEAYTQGSFYDPIMFAKAMKGDLVYEDNPLSNPDAGKSKIVNPLRKGMEEISALKGWSKQFKMADKEMDVPYHIAGLSDLTGSEYTPADILGFLCEVTLDLNNVVGLGLISKASKAGIMAKGLSTVDTWGGLAAKAGKEVLPELGELAIKNKGALAQMASAHDPFYELFAKAIKGDADSIKGLAVVDNLLEYNKVSKMAAETMAAGVKDKGNIMLVLEEMAKTEAASKGVLDELVPGLTKGIIDGSINKKLLEKDLSMSAQLAESVTNNITQSMEAIWERAKVLDKIDGIVSKGYNEGSIEELKKLIPEIDSMSSNAAKEDLGSRVENLINEISERTNPNVDNALRFPDDGVSTRYKDVGEIWSNTTGDAFKDELMRESNHWLLLDKVAKTPGVGFVSDDYAMRHASFDTFDDSAREFVKQSIIKDDYVGDIYASSLRGHFSIFEDDIISAVNKKMRDTGVKDIDWATLEVLSESSTSKLPGGQGVIRSNILDIGDGKKWVFHYDIDGKMMVTSADGIESKVIKASDIKSVSTATPYDFAANANWNSAFRNIVDQFTGNKVSITSGWFKKATDDLGIFEALFVPGNFHKHKSTRHMTNYAAKVGGYIEYDTMRLEKELSIVADKMKKSNLFLRKNIHPTEIMDRFITPFQREKALRNLYLRDAIADICSVVTEKEDTGIIRVIKDSMGKKKLTPAQEALMTRGMVYDRGGIKALRELIQDPDIIKQCDFDPVLVKNAVDNFDALLTGERPLLDDFEMFVSNPYSYFSRIKGLDAGDIKELMEIDEAHDIFMGKLSDYAMDTLRESGYHDIGKWGISHYFPLSEKGKWMVQRFNPDNTKVALSTSFVDSELEIINAVKNDAFYTHINEEFLKKGMTPDQVSDVLIELRSHNPLGKQWQEAVDRLGLRSEFDNFSKVYTDDVILDELEKGIIKKQPQFLGVAKNELEPSQAKALTNTLLNMSLGKNDSVRKKMIGVIKNNTLDSTHFSSVQWNGHFVHSEGAITNFFDAYHDSIGEYIRSIVKKRHFGDYRREADRVITELYNSKQSNAADYIKRQVLFVTGQMDDMDKRLNTAILAATERGPNHEPLLLKAVNSVYKLLTGTDLKAESAPVTTITNKLLGVMNAFKLGFRVKSTLKNMTQPLTNTAAITGVDNLMWAYAQLFNKEYHKFGEMSGITLSKSMGEGLENTLGTSKNALMADSFIGKLAERSVIDAREGAKRVAELSMLGFNQVDKVNRYVSMLAAAKQWSKDYAQKAIKDFAIAPSMAQNMAKLGLVNGEDVLKFVAKNCASMTSDDVLAAVKKTGLADPDIVHKYIDTVVNYASDIVGETQFLYGKAAKIPWLRNPLMNMMVGQFKNYELSKLGLFTRMWGQWVENVCDTLSWKGSGGLDKWGEKMIPLHHHSRHLGKMRTLVGYTIANASIGGIESIPLIGVPIAMYNWWNKDKGKHGARAISNKLNTIMAESEAQLESSDIPMDRLKASFIKVLRHGALANSGYSLKHDFTSNVEGWVNDAILSQNFKGILAPWGQVLLGIGDLATSHIAGQQGDIVDKKIKSIRQAVMPTIFYDFEQGREFMNTQYQYDLVEAKERKNGDWTDEDQMSFDKRRADSILNSALTLGYSIKDSFYNTKPKSGEEAIEILRGQRDKFTSKEKLLYKPSDGEVLARTFGFTTYKYNDYLFMMREVAEFKRNNGSRDDKYLNLIYRAVMMREMGQIEDDEILQSTIARLQAEYLEKGGQENGLTDDRIEGYIEMRKGMSATIENLFDNIDDVNKLALIALIQAYIDRGSSTDPAINEMLDEFGENGPELEESRKELNINIEEYIKELRENNR